MEQSFVNFLKPHHLAKQPPKLGEITNSYNWKDQTRYQKDDIGTMVAYSLSTQTFDTMGTPKDSDKD